MSEKYYTRSRVRKLVDDWSSSTYPGYRTALKRYMRLRLIDESKFHEDGWMESCFYWLFDGMERYTLESRADVLIDDLKVLTRHNLPQVESAMLDARKGKRYWDQREVIFSTNEYEEIDIQLTKGHLRVTKAICPAEPCRVYTLEAEEYDEEGTPTNKIRLLTYDTTKKSLRLREYKEPVENNS